MKTLNRPNGNRICED